MKVSFIIPLYNGLKHSQECLRSLDATLPRDLEHEIILVDDGSTDGTRKWLASFAQSPRHRVILNQSNLGYAGANNVGALVAKGENLALVNSDLVFLPGWLEPMLKALESNSRLALVGNVQRRVDDKQVDHAGIRFRANAKLEHIRELPSSLSIRLTPIRLMPAVTAACCIVRREAFMHPRPDPHINLPAQPGFRLSYRNGGEDVDLCLDLRRRGFQVAVVLNSEVLHHVSASRGKSRPHDEANSRNLFGYWRGEIIDLCAADWARNRMLAPLRGAEGSARRSRLSASLHWLGWSKRTPREAWVEIGGAIFYEEIHWRQTLGLPRPPTCDTPADYTVRGLLDDGLQHESRSFRERFSFTLPPGTVEKNIFINGFIQSADPTRPETAGSLGLRIVVNGTQQRAFFPLADGHFNCGIDRPLVVTDEPVDVTVELLGTERENRMAWFGRISASWPLPLGLKQRLQAYRPQHKNRRLRVSQIVADGQAIFDFKHAKPLRVGARAPSTLPLGLNIVGWFRAELGIGESARCMAKAAQASPLPCALIDMRLPCLNRMGDSTYASQLQRANPYRVNVFHIDPPVSRDIDHHHGPAFRAGRRNIAYWAWELPEFPDEWVAACEYYDEIWTPSAFCRDAIAAKTPLPVHVMPHAIEFAAPIGDSRERFKLPSDRTTFLFLYDLNSYQERKNPQAAIEAYRQAFPDEHGVHLVIKTQNPERNADAFKRLQTALTGLRHTTLITDTLSREDVHALEAACDVFVSLHRSEGFGLAVAECMFLGKPVVSTDWSATAEFVSPANGCPVPVDLVELSESHGPYRKGQIWANPRVPDAASAMRRLAESATLRAQLGANAARTIRERFAPSVIGQRYTQRLHAMRLWPQ